MKYIIILFYIALFLPFNSLSAYGQIERSLMFIPDEVDFGTIKEENGKISRKVKAINVSGKPTFIISARTSCGCSAIDYPQTEIAPGDTVMISVTYDPLNRPGKFLKTAKIYSGKERIGNSFKIKGNVIPSKKNLDRAYPEKSGKLRLSSLFINAGEISTKEARPMFVGIYNDSDSSLKMITISDGAPLEAALSPDSIGPYEISTLTLMLKGRLLNQNKEDFLYKAYLVDCADGDTISTIPVGGLLKK